ncbi:rhomboid family intramembrane serine protease [Aureimonas mangrovi]|uniref:rhomboid family intramembrane serine protease n=1 Tax=Aureimonas mangrovi TaxID=2758041 RepID=UPI00163D78E9|nr:rhomboid family intramembrane serine protease [Aureimonas mangrovi]
MENRAETYRQPPRAQQPAFNAPTVIVVSIAVLAALHLLRTQFLGREANIDVLLNFSFISECYSAPPVDVCALRIPGTGFWSPLSHAFLHADWMHLAANCLWLLAFGTPVARRLGLAPFLIFMAIGAIAGAGLFYLFNPTLLAPMIGASGVVSALMGGAARFALGAPGRIGRRDVAYAPRLSIAEALADRTVIIFVAVFFLTNIALGSGFGGIAIAWEAHLGGFAFGFLCFGAFDRGAPRRPRFEDGGLPPRAA